MKNIFYFTFITLFFFSNILAEELDEEFIDKKFDKIYTADFCSTNELNSFVENIIYVQFYPIPKVENRQMLT